MKYEYRDIQKMEEADKKKVIEEGKSDEHKLFLSGCINLLRATGNDAYMYTGDLVDQTLIGTLPFLMVTLKEEKEDTLSPDEIMDYLLE